MVAMRLPRAAVQQPQHGAANDSNSSIAAGLVGVFNAAVRNARAVGSATIRTTRDGFGFSTIGNSDYWVASDTALISTSPTWTILTVLSGTSTNNPTGGVAFYAERPNDTQIIKLGMGDGQTNSAVLVVRDLQGNLVLQRGTADVRTDTGKPRVVVGTRRGPADHRLYVNGRFDVSNTTNVGGSFGATNATIGNDPNDLRSFLAGASLPLVLVWNRSLSDAEIAQVSANPWQVFSGRIVLDTARLVGLMSTVSQTAGTPVSIAGAWLEQSDTASVSVTATVRGSIASTEAGDACAASGVANVSASSLLSESPDSFAAAAALSVATSAALAEANDSASVQLAVAVSASALLVELSDAASLTGSVGSAVAANANWTEANDGVSVAAFAKVVATVSWTEASDGATAAVVVGNAAVAAVAVTEQADGFAMLATVRISASAGWAEASDLAGFTAYVGSQAPIDISRIHPSRIVVFEGSGSRVTPFEGSGSRVTRFE
jgi:hypothetical protein